MTAAEIQDNADKLRAAVRGRGLEFIRIVIPDFVGNLRGKFLSSEEMNYEGEDVAVGLITFTHRGMIMKIPELLAFGNGVLRPIPETLIERSWIRHRQGAKVGQVLCELFNCDGTPVEEDVRRIAKKQVMRLTEKKLAIFSGTSFKIRMFCGGDDTNELEPAHADIRMFAADYLDQFEDFMLDLDSRLSEAKIHVKSMHSENGAGQIKIPILSTWGIDSADHAILFRALAKETAVDHDLRASFMTVPFLHDESPNSAHFNHSLWRIEENGSTTSNVFRDPANPSQLTSEAKHWLAGLLHHAPALTALCCPTTNCYRRIGLPLCPHNSEWDKDDRRTTFRVKTGSQMSDTFVESRLPSSAANPYLVLAGTIAAGLDGLEKQMELSDRKVCAAKLPTTLNEALEALKADDIICEALGRRFIDWFVFQRMEELTFLEGVDVAKSEPEDMKRERENFLIFA